MVYGQVMELEITFMFRNMPKWLLRIDPILVLQMTTTLVLLATFKLRLHIWDHNHVDFAADSCHMWPCLMSCWCAGTAPFTCFVMFLFVVSRSAVSRHLFCVLRSCFLSPCCFIMALRRHLPLMSGLDQAIEIIREKFLVWNRIVNIGCSFERRLETCSVTLQIFIVQTIRRYRQHYANAKVGKRAPSNW